MTGRARSFPARCLSVTVTSSVLLLALAACSPAVPKGAVRRAIVLLPGTREDPFAPPSKPEAAETDDKECQKACKGLYAVDRELVTCRTGEVQERALDRIKEKRVVVCRIEPRVPSP
jgi:hypothetical protein